MTTETATRQKCPGHMRHWFSVHGQAYLRSPVCVRCGAPHPRPIDDEVWETLREFNAHYPGYVGGHVVHALREHFGDAALNIERGVSR